MGGAVRDGDGGTIGVQFNQPLDKTTAENPANYLVNGTLATGARLFVSTVETNATRVVITPGAALSSPYTVTVQSVRDFAGNLIGVRGVGEGGTLGPAAVLANAVADALAPLGIETNELPLAPGRLWAATVLAGDQSPRKRAGQ